MDGPAGSPKRIELEKRESGFGSSSGRTRSYQEDAAVPADLRSALESIGMRTRFNVGRGYGSPPPSHSESGFNNLQECVFTSDKDVLQSVKNTKSAWNRTKSAPLYQNELLPFCGLRADVIQDENGLPNESAAGLSTTSGGKEDDIDDGIGLGDLKRNRDDVFGDWAEEEQEGVRADSTTAVDDAMHVDSKPIARLPKRSSPTAVGLNRVGAQTLPINSGLSSYLASGQGSDWSTQNFSAFTNQSDF